MKLNIFKIATFALVMLVLAGCKKEDISQTDFDNKLYISSSEFSDVLLIKPDSPSYVREIELRTSKPTSVEVTATLAANPKLLGEYRLGYYSPDAVILPEENYAIIGGEATINEGAVESNPIRIEFYNINLLDRAVAYVLPVELTDVVGVGVLESAKVMYYAFKGGALINVVGNTDRNYADINWSNPSVINNLSALTFEVLLRAESWTRDGSDAQIFSVMGIEGQYLIRTGDSNAPGQIQVATNNGNFPSKDEAKVLPLGEWVHVALTHDLVGGAWAIYVDGVKQSEGVKALGVKSLQNGFSISRSWNYNRWFPGEMAEMRIWNRVLSASEINAEHHFYQVEDEDSDGLVVYWRFNEGTGNVVMDHSGNGNHATFNTDLKWVSVELPAI